MLIGMCLLLMSEDSLAVRKMLLCRGKLSLESICLLLVYKVMYPENIFLLRGNHESASINRFECQTIFKLVCSFMISTCPLGFMDSMMSVRGATVLSYGRHSLTVSTACH